VICVTLRTNSAAARSGRHGWCSHESRRSDSKGGRISHEYSDHVSIVKFIERNWGLETITRRSRDNFPNPISTKANPYVPVNSPALGDLFDLFQFNDNE
jgi:phospholipase C